MIGNIKRWEQSQGVTGLRNSFKRTTDIAELDEGSESKHESKEADGEAESTGQYANLYYHTLF